MAFPITSKTLEDSLSKAGFALIVLTLAMVMLRWWAGAPEKLNGFDEAYYNHYSRVLGEHGLTGIRGIIKEYATNPEMQKGPPAFRISFLCLGAMAGKLIGNYEPGNLAWLATLSWFGIIYASYFLFRLWLNPMMAFCSCLLLAASPIQLAMARRALQDTFFTFLVITSVLCLNLALKSRRTLKYHSLFGLLLCLGFLTKESMLFLYPCILLLGLAISYGENRTWRWNFLIPMFAAPVVYLLVSILIAGNFETFQKNYSIYWHMNKTGNEYANVYQKGPWFRYLLDFILISPVTCMLAFAGIIGFRESDPAIREGLTLAMIMTIAGVTVFSFLSVMNIRYVMFADPFLRVMAISGMLGLLKYRENKLPWMLSGLMVLCAFDLLQFHKIFLQHQVYDPVTFQLIRANGFIR